jgi:SsrA-binding protein
LKILKLEQRALQRNCEIIPIRMFFSEKNFVKLELGVGTKKTMGDKRDGEMKKEGERDIRRTMKGGSYD